MAKLRSVLRGYISSVLLDSVLTRALERHMMQSLSGTELYEAVTADCMIGLRMFVNDDDLPALMLELTDFLEEMAAKDRHLRREAVSLNAEGVAIVDARGRSCPLPLVLASHAIHHLRVGDTLLVMADDRSFVADIRAWVQRSEHSLIDLQTKPSHFEATLRKVR